MNNETQKLEILIELRDHLNREITAIASKYPAPEIGQVWKAQDTFFAVILGMDCNLCLVAIHSGNTYPLTKFNSNFKYIGEMSDVLSVGRLTMTLKPGDRVVCVNDRNIDMIKNGEIYIVEMVAPNGRSILLQDQGPLGFNVSRFKRVSDHCFAASNDWKSTEMLTQHKPPLGLKPRSVHTNERILDIKDACNRYIAEKKDIPHEWISELFDLEDAK